MENTTHSNPVADRLIALHDAIKDVDVAAGDKNNMLGKTYELTWNNVLGFGKNPETYHVFLPYGTWAKYDEVKATEDNKLAVKVVPSLLAAGFKDVVAKEFIQPAPSNGHYFIDIACLGDLDFEFMTQANNGHESVVTAIANLVNGITDDKVTPVIRILVGKDALNKHKKTDQDINDTYSNMFWNEKGPLIHNGKAVLYVGRYAPDFHHNLSSKPEHRSQVDALAAAIDGLGKWVRTQLNLLVTLQPNAGKAIEGLNVKAVTDYLITTGLPSISWNHAKLVAVNGSTSMTGGGNFWGPYANDQHDIIDMQAKVRGDAAVSAHKYCNYFWEYLNALAGISANAEHNITDENKIDTNSFMSMISLSGNKSEWKDPKTAVPLFPPPPNWVTPAGLGPPPKSDPAKIPVLTVAKLGDWTGTMTIHVRFPVQFIDALRDIVRNVFWNILQSLDLKVFGLILKASAYNIVAKQLSNQAMLGKTPGENGLKTQNINISPAAWASRVARCHAIATAKTSVRICTELFATFLMEQHETQVTGPVATQGAGNDPNKKSEDDPKNAYKEILATINKNLDPKSQ